MPFRNEKSKIIPIGDTKETSTGTKYGSKKQTALCSWGSPSPRTATPSQISAKGLLKQCLGWTRSGTAIATDLL